MEKICKKIVEKLKEQNKTVAFMESCTGGFLSNEITNILGASEVLKVSLITYSSEYKIKFGVDKNVINNYTVYSNEVSQEMAKKVTSFANSNIGVGITGELGNTINRESKVYYSIYFAENKKCVSKIMKIEEYKRVNMKKKVAKNVLLDILKEI